MPKLADPTPHFDAAALLDAVAQQDIGICILTNNDAAFRRIMYMAMSKGAPRCYIYSVPNTSGSFFLLKQPPPDIAPDPDEEADDNAS